jgi:FkbM family methyltransferase
LIDWCRHVLTPDTDFLDIGAHAGTYALSLAPHCRRVFAFEAQRMTFYQLCGGIAINHYRNVFPHHCALGEQPDMATLNITSPDGGGSTLDTQIPSKQQQKILGQELCHVKTLDSFVLYPTSIEAAVAQNVSAVVDLAASGGSARVGLIKIDVEGHELAVLRGARETIAKNGHPPILFEAWADPWYEAQKQELLQFIIKELKYSSIKQAPNTNNMFLAQK